MLPPLIKLILLFAFPLLSFSVLSLLCCVFVNVFNDSSNAIGRHTARPHYMDCKPDWSLISRSSPMSHSNEDHFKTLANNSLPSHMRSTFKYIHPAQIGQTNNYTKLRNFKKFHTDIQKTMQDANKDKQRGRHAIHKPEVQYLNGMQTGSRRSNRSSFQTSQRSFR